MAMNSERGRINAARSQVFRDCGVSFVPTYLSLTFRRSYNPKEYVLKLAIVTHLVKPRSPYVEKFGELVKRRG